MIEVTLFRGLTVGVFGLGKTGKASIYALKSGGSKVIAWDDDEEKRLAWLKDNNPEHLALSLQNILVNPSDTRWTTIRALVLSPGIPLNHPIVTIAERCLCPIVCDIELLHKTCTNAKYIGVTGTNGKSTTTSLIGHILKNAGIRTEIGGNIGTAALDLQPLASDGAYVLELSSFQLDMLYKMHLNISVLLNITRDHIDHHGSMEKYINAKTKLFLNQGPNDTAIIGIDTAPTREIFENLKKAAHIGRIIPISTEQRVPGGVSVLENKLYNDIDSQNPLMFDLGHMPYLQGKHNQENYAAGFAATYVYSIPAETIISAISSYKGLKHRQQYLGKLNKITFINDSKATNAESAATALSTYNNIYWIVGGTPKEGGIESLDQALLARVMHAFLIGQSEADFANTLQSKKVAFTKCGTLQNAFNQAVQMAKQHKEQDSVILLSPACASYDQWRNFEERGDAFCAMVENLKNA